MDLNQRIEAYWNGRSETFGKQREADWLGENHLLWQKELASHLPSQPLKILDVGCGCGYFTFLLREMGHQVWGVDLAEEMIKKAQELAAKYGYQADFQVMNAEHLDFESEMFDVVVSRNLTWTLPDAKKAYQEWLRVLKPGGLLLNYDAQHAKHHQTHGLAQEKAHALLSQNQQDECMALYALLPLSLFDRPTWDEGVLHSLGCHQVWLDLAAGPRLQQPYDSFLVKARK